MNGNSGGKPCVNSYKLRDNAYNNLCDSCDNLCDNLCDGL